MSIEFGHSGNFSGSYLPGVRPSTARPSDLLTRSEGLQNLFEETATSPLTLSLSDSGGNLDLMMQFQIQTAQILDSAEAVLESLDANFERDLNGEITNEVLLPAQQSAEAPRDGNGNIIAWSDFISEKQRFEGLDR
jgi:hypothetical protein